jgi:hypothetical protein
MGKFNGTLTLTVKAMYPATLKKEGESGRWGDKGTKRR